MILLFCVIGAACLDVAIAKPCFVLQNRTFTDRTCGGCFQISSGRIDNGELYSLYDVGCVSNLYRVDKRDLPFDSVITTNNPATTATLLLPSTLTTTDANRTLNLQTSRQASNGAVIGIVAAVIGKCACVFFIKKNDLICGFRCYACDRFGDYCCCLLL